MCVPLPFTKFNKINTFSMKANYQVSFLLLLGTVILWLSLSFIFFFVVVFVVVKTYISVAHC